MFFENLAGHLDSKAHREIINQNNEVDEAIKYLKTKPQFPQKSLAASNCLLNQQKSKQEENKDTCIEDDKSLSFDLKNNEVYFRFQMAKFIMEKNMPFSFVEKMFIMYTNKF